MWRLKGQALSLTDLLFATIILRLLQIAVPAIDILLDVVRKISCGDKSPPVASKMRQFHSAIRTELGHL
jgi:hypothetical protein